MSKKIPALKPSQILKGLVKAGFFIQRQSGSHVRLKHPQKTEALTIARHDRFEFSHVITQRILKRADISEEEFLDLL